ncbi:MAG: pantetheine-phosphate adenylyltransferase [Kiloniellales bacterium]
MGKPLIGVYPGTFDPITNGHIDIIRRATRVVDRLIVAVAKNDGKGPLFGTEDRLDMVRDEIAEIESNGAVVEARAFSSLLINFADSVHASVIIRGLRAVSDFEYEFQMAGMNTRMAPHIETLFLMASERHQFVSSRFVKEIGRFGGDISTFVTKRVETKLDARFAELQ